VPQLDDSVAYADNWKTVLAADAASALVVVAIGIAILATVHVVVGGLIAAVAASYMVLVARRGRRWAALRREAGL